MSNEEAPLCSHRDEFVSYNRQGERRTLYVLALTVVTMGVEIVAGTVFGSMALLADGWHMGTHAAAFCITLFTYRYAKKYHDSERFSFGTGKVSVLGGYTSAIALGIVALVMLGESTYRLFNPQTIQFNEAIVVAVIGLVVNLASVLLLHDHDHDHQHNHQHGHSDHNLRAAYIHVMADALTSVLAIVALIVGKYVGWNWLDAIMGIVGALVISKWTWGLLKQTGPVLLDASIERAYKEQVLDVITPHAHVSDFHIWKVSADHYAAAMSLQSSNDKNVDDFKQLLSNFDKIHHLTIEVNHV